MPLCKIISFHIVLVFVSFCQVSVATDTIKIGHEEVLPIKSPDSSSLGKTSDGLAEPEWLHDVPAESKVAKNRKRRFLSFPTSSSLTITFIWYFPVSGIASSSSLFLQNDIVFNLPTNSSGVVINIGSLGRSMEDQMHHRIDVYRSFEEFIDGYGLDGHECVLRSICEIAEMPFENGIIGDVINLVFSALMDPTGHEVYDEYTTAEYYGHHHGDCGIIYPKCTMSLLSLVSKDA